jgi:riboflavin synthase alpha subunit
MSHTGNRVNFRGRDVGHVDGTTFITERRPEHVMIKFKGFGISMNLLEFLIKELGIIKVRIEYHSLTLNRVYEFPLLAFLTSENYWVDNTTDGKEDLQKFVSLEEQDWNEIKEGLPFFKKIKKNGN